ncbi:MAG: ATP-binding cassette domain-containing protein [Acidimicrobiaceae bacterium]|nr:ATP-binding cassette domain-containing protein [Acidimicrobiaceae bacterium]MYF32037.1 ATP-binding cassette domain-containing protein [Acidimicrobiaceae bacterium]
MGESETPAAVVEFDEVSRRFSDTLALDSVSFTVRQGEFFSIIGPSGSGKTTTVRMIAGLEAPTVGTVKLFGKDVSAVPPHRRGTPMVFQSYALFPHLNIRDNVAYGLRMRGVAKPERRNRADDLLGLVGLEGLGDRRSEQLSGGQQQRVALARAIATEPRVVLLDEALGALDAALRIEMQVELKRLQKELACTFIHVTHDQSEAIAMADRILVLQGGRLEQVGTPAEVFARPKTRFVAAFVGQNNLMDATSMGITGDGLHKIHTPLGEFLAKESDGHPIVREVAARGKPAVYGTIKEGYNMWFHGIVLSAESPNYDAAVAYANFWHEGFAPAEVANQGYMTPTPSVAQPALEGADSPDAGVNAWDYWYNGGGRDRGSVDDIASKAAWWWQFPDESEYLESRWQDFVAA